MGQLLIPDLWYKPKLQHSDSNLLILGFHWLGFHFLISTGSMQQNSIISITIHSSWKRQRSVITHTVFMTYFWWLCKVASSCSKWAETALAIFPALKKTKQKRNVHIQFSRTDRLHRRLTERWIITDLFCFFWIVEHANYVLIIPPFLHRHHISLMSSALWISKYRHNKTSDTDANAEEWTRL